MAADVAELNAAQEKVAATVQGVVLRFFREPPYTDLDQVLSKALAKNVVLALVEEGFL